MKLSSIFKKGKKTTVKTSAQTLDKKQLEKVVGGTETKPLTSIQDENKSILNLIR